MADQSRNAVIAHSDLERLVFELPPLPYGTKDLEPVLSAETLEIHHGKHHARYVETLNRLLSEQNFSAQRLEEIIRIAHGSGTKGVFNNAAQAWNHSFFWESMAPKAVKPSGLLASAISSEFGSLETLGEERAISDRAGSGSSRSATSSR